MKILNNYVEKNNYLDENIRFLLNERCLTLKGERVGTYIRPINDVEGFNTVTIAKGLKKHCFGDSIFKISVWPHRKE